MNRYAKTTGILTLALAALFLWGCDQSPMTPKTEHAVAGAAVQKLSMQKPAQINEAFEEVAASLAKALQSKSLRLMLKKEFQQYYTDAPEVLYQWIRDENLADGATLRKHLAQARNQVSGEAARTLAARPEGGIDAVARSIPKLHIAMPAYLKSWNAAEEVPLVAYVPEGIDDMEMKYVTAFDAEGNVYQLREEDFSKHYAVVLAVNERTDAQGNVLPAYVEPCPGCGGGGGGCYGPTGPRDSGDAEYVYAAKVENDHEKVWLEPAEISFRAFPEVDNNTAYADKELGDPEPKGHWQYCEGEDGVNFVTKIFRWYWDDYGEYFLMDWYEHDEAGRLTPTLNYTFPDDFSISVEYEKTEDDDYMGRVVVNKDGPVGDVYDTGQIKWKNRW